MNRKFFTQNKIIDLPVDRQIEYMQSCSVRFNVDKYTAVIGSTITSTTIIDPPGTYMNNDK